MAAWPLARRAAQLVVVPVQQSDVEAAAPLVAQGMGGLILFGSSAPADLGRQLAGLDMLAPGGVQPLVMTDEEGGGVQRMANLVGSLPWPRQMAQDMTPGQVGALAAQTARRMRAAGVTMDLAPVLDVDGGTGPNSRDPDGLRSFSADPATAARFGLAFMEGLLQGGVIPVIKHFPGLGGATANTDYGPASTPALAVLQQRGLHPFEAALVAGAPAVMVANASVPGLTAMPASLSTAAIQGLLRTTLGFQGLVITDSLSAGAVQAAGYDVPAAAVAAVEAGADMVLFSAAGAAPVAAQVVAALVRAVQVGALPVDRLDAAVAHVLATKQGVGACSAGQAGAG